MHKVLTNPFERIAGGRAFAIGFVGVALTAFIAYVSGTHSIGLFNLHFAKGAPFWVFALEQFLSWGVLVLIAFPVTAVLSKSKIRIIDFMGTFLLAHLPLILAPTLRLIPWFRSFSIFSVEMFVIVGVHLFTLIWVITLLFNAYKISSNLKGNRLIFSFILSLVSSEIVVFLILYFLNR